MKDINKMHKFLWIQANFHENGLTVHSPSVSESNLLKRIVRYVKGNVPMGINFSNDTDSIFQAYSYSDWSGCSSTWRSTGGFYTFLGANVMSWSSEKQPTDSCRSTEAEYGDAWTWCFFAGYTRSLLWQPLLGSSPFNPAYLRCFKLPLGALVVRHIRVRYQSADIFTKSLLAPAFYSLSGSNWMLILHQIWRRLLKMHHYRW